MEHATASVHDRGNTHVSHVKSIAAMQEMRMYPHHELEQSHVKYSKYPSVPRNTREAPPPAFTHNIDESGGTGRKGKTRRRARVRW